MTTYRGIAYSSRGPGRRSRHSSRWSDDQPGCAGKLRAGRRAAGVWCKRQAGCLRQNYPQLLMHPLLRGAGTGERCASKGACTVREGADGKGPARHLASRLLHSAGNRQKRAIHVAPRWRSTRLLGEGVPVRSPPYPTARPDHGTDEHPGCHVLSFQRHLLLQRPLVRGPGAATRRRAVPQSRQRLPGGQRCGRSASCSRSF